jgi:hypothetical protein
MMKLTSTLTFFSWDQEKSKAREAELVGLRKELNEATDETSEEQLATLQRAFAKVEQEAEQLRTVKLKIIKTADFKALPHIKLTQLTAKQEYEQRKELILKCAELPLDKFNTLKSPDFLKLYSMVKVLNFRYCIHSKMKLARSSAVLSFKCLSLLTRKP